MMIARRLFGLASLWLLVLLGSPPGVSGPLASPDARSLPDHFLSYGVQDSRGSLCSADAPQNVGSSCETEAECGGTGEGTDFCVPKNFPKGLRVTLTDHFETRTFDVGKPLGLYLPANESGGIQEPSTHLEGYRIKLTATRPRQPSHQTRANLGIRNQFHPAGSELVVDTIKPELLLIPTAMALGQPVAPPDPASHSVDDYKCYGVKTHEGTGRFARIVDVSVVDQFEQPRRFDLVKPTRLCAPVATTPPPDGPPRQVQNSTGYLMCYRAVLTPTSPRQPQHEKVRGFFVNNQFGPGRLDTTLVEELCVPSLVVTASGCSLGEVRACYDGPVDTAGVGQCRAGSETCLADGAFGPCEGQVLPSPEIHENAIDEDCDGLTPQCAPGSTLPCYAGPSGTEHVGICRAGVRTCDPAGTFGACIGEVVPGTEIPDNGIDEDCDGSDETSEELPPDPAEVAPPVDGAVVTRVAESTAFLYSGSAPIQTGVAPGTIEPRRAAVLRGRVVDRDGAPIPGVTISILDHAEFGQTLTRDDGMFDVAVNGGSVLTLRYEKPPYLPVQRQVEAPWQDYLVAPDVVMLQRDPQVTTVDLGADIPMQAARGSRVSDSDGTRQATVLIPQGTQAEVLLPDGSTQPVSTLHIRLTEYTVGSNGPAAMPGPLPPTSGYTYAVELGADEAVAKIGDRDVVFSQPVFFYVENFLAFPVGGIVPAGFYDQGKAAWNPSDNGRVIRLVGVTGDLADLDTDGDNAVDDGGTLGITDAERRQLAALYPAGQSLWRVPVWHFSTCDLNWPLGPPAGAKGPGQPDPGSLPENQPPQDQSCQKRGSIIECQNQTLGERVRVSGTPFTVNYRSDRAPARRDSFSLHIQLSGEDVPEPLRRIELEIQVAGQRSTHTYPAAPHQSHEFVWDGRDAYGRLLQGGQTATVRIGYVYGTVGYTSPDALAQAFARAGGTDVLTDGTRQELTFWQEYESPIGGIFDLRPQGLGGWSLDVHHVYDPFRETLYLGNGDRRSGRGSAVDQVIDRVAAGRGTAGVAVTPDGSIYVAESGGHRVLRTAPDGGTTAVAGTGVAGCGGPASATLHRLNTPTSLAPGPGGVVTRLQPREGGEPVVVLVPRPILYITDSFCNQIHELTPDGFIHTIAGTGVAGYDPGIPGLGGDEIPATSARLNRPQGIAVARDGSLYVADTENHRIRRIEPGPDGFLGQGIITTVAGTGAAGFSGDDGPATLAQLNRPAAVAIGIDGSLYIADSSNHRVRRVGPDGIIATVAGTGVAGFSGDGGPASTAQLRSPAGVVHRPDGALIISDTANDRLRQVGPGDLITTLAGGAFLGMGDGGPASAARLSRPTALALLPDQSLLVADSGNASIRRIGSVLPSFSAGELSIVSERGDELYVFDATGRHLVTLHTLTGAILYSFAYDPAGRLATVTDRGSNVTTIARGPGGAPTALVSPDGQRTDLGVDGNGYLASLADPAGGTDRFTYHGDEGLLATRTDPRGGVHRFTFDEHARLIRDEDPAGGSTTLSRMPIDTGHRVTSTTGEGRVTEYSVGSSAAGRERQVTLPDGTQTLAQLGRDGTQWVTHPDGMILSGVHGPDPRFGMRRPLLIAASATTPDGLFGVATRSRTAALADPANPLSLQTETETLVINGRTFARSYDAASRTFTVTTPAGRHISATLDPEGRLVHRQVDGLLPYTYEYDGRGRLSRATIGTGPGERSLSIAYDDAGRPITFTDSLGRPVRRYAYDTAGRIDRETLPDGSEILYTNDGNGNVVSLTPPGRPAHMLTYSPVDLVASYTPPDVGLGSTETRFVYDRDRQLTRILSPDGQTVDIGYDAAGRVSTRTLPNGQGQEVHTYEPDTGRLASLTAPGGVTLSYRYDGALLTRETWAGPVSGVVGRSYDEDFRVASESVNGTDTIFFQYDADGLPVQAGVLSLSPDARHGLVTSAVLGGVSDAWTYNGFAEVESHRAAFAGADFYAVQHVRDPLGRIMQTTETVGGVTESHEYAYDPSERLAEVRRNGVLVDSYSYDDNGNRLTVSTQNGVVTATYDDQDRLQRHGGPTYAYTANGELLTKTVASATTTYGYDLFANLRNVSLPDGTQIEYLIDGRGRRIGKRVNGVLVQGFLYLNHREPIAELDGNNAVVSRFVYASRDDVPDYMIKGGATYRIISDHLGSPRLIVDVTSGAIVQRLDYDAFGNVTLDTNPGFQPFGFTGGIYDRHTGLTRLGARDYDAETGRWTAKDALGLASGPNLYAYVENDPVNARDPEGTGIFRTVATLLPIARRLRRLPVKERIEALKHLDDVQAKQLPLLQKMIRGEAIFDECGKVVFSSKDLFGALLIIGAELGDALLEAAPDLVIGSICQICDFIVIPDPKIFVPQPDVT